MLLITTGFFLSLHFSVAIAQNRIKDAARGDFTKIAMCDVEFLKLGFEMIGKHCVNENSDKKIFQCSKEIVEDTTPYLCSAMAEKHYQNQTFFFEQKLFVVDLLEKKKISRVEYDKKINSIVALSEKEIKDFWYQYNKQIEEYKSYALGRIAEINARQQYFREDSYRTNATIEAINILNGPSLNPKNAPKTEHYFIRGKSFSCTTINNFTSCN